MFYSASLRNYGQPLCGHVIEEGGVPETVLVRPRNGQTKRFLHGIFDA